MNGWFCNYGTVSVSIYVVIIYDNNGHTNITEIFSPMWFISKYGHFISR